MTSAMTCTVPAEWLTIVSVPEVVSRPTRRLATVWPAAKLAVELPVVAVESALRKPAARGEVAVRLIAAAVAPAGTGDPVTPATLMVSEAPAAIAVRTGLAVVPTRVSSRRVGVTGTRCEKDEGRTAADGVEAGPAPMTFVAVTVKV